MPTYVYENCAHLGPGVQEHNVPIDDRDKVRCRICGCKMTRKMAFTGLTWAPTAGGMR